MNETEVPTNENTAETVFNDLLEGNCKPAVSFLIDNPFADPELVEKLADRKLLDSVRFPIIGELFTQVVETLQKKGNSTS